MAKITGSVPFSPASVSLSMLAVSAEAKTSAGAPWVICCTSADEASKLKVALASGLASVKASPTAVNDSVSEAAANTVMSPSTAGAVVVAAAVVAAAVVVAAVSPLRGRGGRRRRAAVVVVAASRGEEGKGSDRDDEQAGQLGHGVAL